MRLVEINCYIICVASLIANILATHPIALFHGIGDSCHFPPMIELIEYLKNSLKVEVKCLEIGNGFVSSWFMQFNKQADEACEKIKQEQIFKDKFSVVGISQGSLIGRYIIQKCDMSGQVINYVSINGPQAGIGSLPKITCPVICPVINRIVGKWIYSDYFQKNLGPAGYYKDRYLYNEFLQFSTFLADLNNEREVKSSSYKQRFSSLERVLLIKSREDSVITPRESSWFEFYDRDGSDIIPLKNSQFYTEDYIGLRTLDEQNKLTLVEIEGDHVKFTYSQIDQYVIPVLK